MAQHGCEVDLGGLRSCLKNGFRKNVRGLRGYFRLQTAIPSSGGLGIRRREIAVFGWKFLPNAAGPLFRQLLDARAAIGRVPSLREDWKTRN